MGKRSLAVGLALLAALQPGSAVRGSTVGCALRDSILGTQVRPSAPAPPPDEATRRRAVIGVLGSLAGACLAPEAARALVKGSTPAPGTGRAGVKKDRPKCTSIDDCQALGDVKASELFVELDPSTIMKTKGGDRYVDTEVGTGAALGAGGVGLVRYRVLRQGKRSRDGLSGEASLIYSLGYGEDEDKVGDTVELRLGTGKLVAALDEGLLGMKTGGRRRINVRPERGWKLPDAQCLTTYTDMTIVPTTKVQENDACFSQGVPAPNNYAQRRRMLRRYDETLIVDCELVKVLS